MGYNFDKVLTDLKEDVKQNKVMNEKFKTAIKLYYDLGFEIQKIIEYAFKYTQSDEKDNLYKLFREFSLKNSGELYERLRNIGLGLKKNKEVYERFYDNDKKRPKGISYRIMELTRLGKREEVLFTLLNEFQGAYFPQELATAFNPIYSDELFKTFVYSFLSGILGETKDGGVE